MESNYRETYYLSAGETNAEQEMALPLLVAKLIDIATAHANSLGIGNPSMSHMNAGWVLSRLTIEMEKYPKVNSSYTIATWIESFNRHFSERAFKIESADGGVYGYARSIWMVMDTTEHKNLGLSHLSLPDGIEIGNPAPIAGQMRHVPIVEHSAGFGGAKNVMVATAPPFDYLFKYCDLDSYRHVNTVRYVELLLNRFTLEEHDSSFVKRLELSFLHEARYGMYTQILRADTHGTLLSTFQLSDRENNTPLFFARLLRAPRNT